MFSNFLSYFNESVELNYSDDLYSDFLSQLGGKIFGNGLFNSFSKDNLEKWELFVGVAYPEFKSSFKLFGYDWLGRCFGMDLRESSNGNILMFEIGTNDVLEIPCSFKDFLNVEIPLYSDACLAKSFFDEWTEYSKETIEYGKCVSYKIPLCLGGEDTIQNLELSDMEVYWVTVSSKYIALRFKGQEAAKEEAKRKTDWSEEIFEYIKMTLDLFRKEYNGFEAVKLVFTMEDSPQISFRTGEDWIDIDFSEMQYKDGKDRDNYRECYYRDEVVWYEYIGSECPKSLASISSQVCRKLEQEYGVEICCEIE